MPKTPFSNSNVTLWLKNAFSLGLRSQTSSNPSETTNGRGLDTSPSRPDVYDAPDSVEHDGSRLLSPGVRSDRERTIRTRSSRESAHPTISTTRSQHERHPSSSRQKPAVRLLEQERAAAPPGMTRLKASQALCTLIVTY